VIKINRIYLFLSIAPLIIFGVLYLNSFLNAKQLSVILITIDALRPDHLNCYGYQRHTSPNIDELAGRGVMFTQAIAQAPWTTPSMCSIATAVYPHKFMVFSETESSADISSLPTLQGILRRNGYKTAFISSNPSLSRSKGFKDGFDKFNCWLPDNDNLITKVAIEWLGDKHNRPFFLWVHYIGPHAPYRPPWPYDMLYLEEKSKKTNRNVPIGYEKKDKFDGRKVIPKYAALYDITSIDYYIDQYDGEIAFSDEQVGILLREMKKLNVYKDTLIILSADHGESLGEHDYYFGHGWSLYDVLLKVPLIIVYNRIIPAHEIIKKQISIINIMPTIFDILNIKENIKTRGHSALPLMSGKEKDYHNHAFSGRYFKTEEAMAAIRTDEWKLIHNLGKEGIEDNSYELYNLKQDPGELNNILLHEKKKFQSLKQKLDRWAAEEVKPITSNVSVPMDKLTEEMMKSLGYLQ